MTKTTYPTADQFDAAITEFLKLARSKYTTDSFGAGVMTALLRDNLDAKGRIEAIRTLDAVSKSL